MTKELYFRTDRPFKMPVEWVDENFDRLMYYSSDWVANQTYSRNEVVRHKGKLWVVKNTIASTTQEPGYVPAVTSVTGYNFRNTENFVTDQVGYSWVDPSQVFGGGNSWGWSQSISGFDNSNAVDPSLAGSHHAQGFGGAFWTLLLPNGPGTYDLKVAFFSEGNTNVAANWEIFDGDPTTGTKVATISQGLIGTDVVTEYAQRIPSSGWDWSQHTGWNRAWLNDRITIQSYGGGIEDNCIASVLLDDGSVVGDPDPSNDHWELIGYVPDPSPMVWKKPWEAGTYVEGDVVTHETMLWVVEKESTTQEPDLDSVINETSDWGILARSPTALAEMGMDAPTADADITAAWADLDMFTSEQWDPINIETNVGLGQFKFLTAGIYEVVFFGNLDHDSDNKGRTFNFRLYNVTDGVGAAGVPVGVAREQLVSSIAITFPMVVDDAAVDDGDWFNFQVGDASDTIGSVVWNALQFHIKRIA